MSSKLFFKYFSILIVIVCEIILDIVFAIRFGGWITLYFFITSLVSVAVLACVNFHIQKKELLIPWFLVMMFFPLVGLVLCFVFYQKINAVKLMKKKFENECPCVSKNFMDVQAKYYAWGKDFFEDIKKQVKKAKKYVFFEFFIVEYGKLFDELIEILKMKIADGVEVFMLVDEIGSINRLPKNFFRDMRELGIRCQKFDGFSSGFLHNNRDHRKVVAIDGNVAFVGGANIADEYVGEKQKFGIWKDGGVKIVGEGAMEFAKSFCTMFCVASKKKCCPKHFDFKSKLKISDGQSKNLFMLPSCIGENLEVEREIVALIDEAKEEIKISTPYFIPDGIIQSALYRAARRGVKIKIFVPGIADKKLVNMVTKSHYENAISNGIEMLEFEKGFIHSKNILVDKATMLVGTINIDYRSFFRNFECAVIIKNSSAVQELSDDFKQIEKQCKKVEAKDLPRPNFFIKLLKLFAPVL